MTTAEINTLTQLSEPERPQILTTLLLAQTNPYMAGYLVTRKKSNFVLFEGESLWLYQCQNHFSPLYTKKEKCFDKIPISYQDTLCYVDTKSQQTYSFARETLCDGNPANIIALDTDGIEFCLQSPLPIKQNRVLNLNLLKFVVKYNQMQLQLTPQVYFHLNILKVSGSNF